MRKYGKVGAHGEKCIIERKEVSLKRKTGMGKAPLQKRREKLKSLEGGTCGANQGYDIATVEENFTLCVAGKPKKLGKTTRLQKFGG